MNWNNVKQIYCREMRDQLRDRRTLFLIAVLPLLLYPLLGMSVFQLTQFLQTSAGRVAIVGGEQLDAARWLPRLVEGDRFALQLFDLPEQAESLELVSPLADSEGDSPKDPAAGDKSVAELRDESLKRLVAGELDAVVDLPDDFVTQLEAVRRAMIDRGGSQIANLPEPMIRFNSADDQSRLARTRVEDVLRRWRSEIVASTLAEGDVPVQAAEPFSLRGEDVAQPQLREAATWSKILPFIVFIWALTGAFYPAVDLCAGEKERGTLETLLTSPALRREIVWGKLLTVMTFSNATALLNLLSMGLTGKFVIDQLNRVVPGGATAGLALPPLASLVWLGLALVPISALFSALCLALAALARSTKEGQYYLMPLMLVSMPLMMLPMSPGVELNLGNSLAPLTGVVLLMRSVIEGQYREALPFVAPVLGVTLVCCLLAIRWAEEQFHRESVLFRESERWELRSWLVHLVRDRGETPSFAQAALCVAIILAVQFFASVSLSSGGSGGLSFGYLVKSVLVSQIACILAPSLLMTLLLTSRPARTLLLDRRPQGRQLAAAVALAVLLHAPTIKLLGLIDKLYPVKPEVAASSQAIEAALATAPHFWQVLLLMAVLPPICEELAFRGFILSGLRHVGHKWWSIGLSAAAFGAVHLFLQQKISAAAIGVVIGFLAVQTSSLWPCIVYHVLHNGLQLGAMRLAGQLKARGDVDSWPARLLTGESPLLYSDVAVAACLVTALAVAWSLGGRPPRQTSEEQLEQARLAQAGAMVGA
jgi:sodium transport system permease protein